MDEKISHILEHLLSKTSDSKRTVQLLEKHLTSFVEELTSPDKKDEKAALVEKEEQIPETPQELPSPDVKNPATAMLMHEIFSKPLSLRGDV